MYVDLRLFIDDIRNNWKAVAARYQYARSSHFYSQEFINILLFNRTFRNLPKTKYIDYNLSFVYYPKHRKTFELEYKDETKTMAVPYVELINFINRPDAKIQVEGPITEYHQPAEIRTATQSAFKAFMADKPKTFNGAVLRLADLQAKDGRYSARLERSGYFDEIHTSLTIDHLLDGELFETMRTKDLAKDGGLPPLKNSLLDNHVGVFTAVGLYSDGRWYFHMLPRHKKLGVFSGMLSSVSGGVEPPRRQITELVGHVTDELKREFVEETGLNAEELEATGRCKFIPLALTRELSRGGKPQFFYLTVLNDVTKKEFIKAFKRAGRKSEFRSDPFSKIAALDEVVSPEFSTALFYALTYIQKQGKYPTDRLILS